MKQPQGKPAQSKLFSQFGRFRPAPAISAAAKQSSSGTATVPLGHSAAVPCARRMYSAGVEVGVAVILAVGGGVTGASVGTGVVGTGVGD